MAKITIQRNTITGEMVSAEVEIDHSAQWISKVTPLFDFIDARMIKLNDRVLKANQSIGNLDDTTYEVVRNIIAGTQGYAIPSRDPNVSKQLAEVAD